MEEEQVAVVLPYTPPQFRRGDFDGDGSLQLDDAIQLLGYLFIGAAPSSCPDAADVNDSGEIDVADAVWLLGYLFVPGSPLPPAPGPVACGADGVSDSFGYCMDASCP
jgi:hypothetical protein